MVIEPGNRPSASGVFPPDWGEDLLGNLFTFSNGVNADRNAYGEGLRFINVLEPITYSHLYGPEIPGRVSLRDSAAAAYAVRKGDVLFNRTSETEADLGLAAAYLGTEHVVFGGFVIRGRPIDGRLDPRYSGYALRAPAIRSQIVPMGQGAIRSNIGQHSLRLVIAPIPPKAEQRAIAAALGDVDGLLGGLDRLIAKKRNLKQGVMQRLLTGQTRLPGFSGEWEMRRLDHAGRCLRGVSYKPDSDLSRYDTSHTKRLLRANNVQDALIVVSDVQFVSAVRVSLSQVLKRNDVLICMANGSKALVGKAGLFAVDDGFDYTFGAFMGCFRTDPTTADAAFVFLLFQTQRYRDYIKNLLAGSSINNLKPSTLEALEFSFPSLKEQAAIATVLSDMDAELAALEARRHKTVDLKHAMMHELLTGKTRLVPAGATGA